MFILIEAVLLAAAELILIFLTLRLLALIKLLNIKLIAVVLFASYIALNYIGYAIYSSSFTALFQLTYITFWLFILLLAFKAATLILKKIKLYYMGS